MPVDHAFLQGLHPKITIRVLNSVPIAADCSAFAELPSHARLPAFTTIATISLMPHVLVCPPNYFDIIDQKNPYMSLTHAVDRVKARSQWENLCSVLQQNGCEIETIDPIEGLEDMVFAANQLFVGQKSGHGKFVVPSRM